MGSQLRAKIWRGCVMIDYKIHMSDGTFDALRKHLSPVAVAYEEAAFLFARSDADGDLLTIVESELIPPPGFVMRSRFYLELTDETRARVIKRAHDLSASIIECHSHPGQKSACFSWSDL